MGCEPFLGQVRGLGPEGGEEPAPSVGNSQGPRPGRSGGVCARLPRASLVWVWFGDHDTCTQSTFGTLVFDHRTILHPRPRRRCRRRRRRPGTLTLYLHPTARRLPRSGLARPAPPHTPCRPHAASVRPRPPHCTARRCPR